METNNNNTSSNMVMENNNIYYPMIMFPPQSHQHHQNHNSSHQNKLCCSSSTVVGAHNYDHLIEMEKQSHQNNIININDNNNINNGCSSNTTDNSSSISSIKAKIVGHPHYPRLLSCFINCQKVGAPPEVVARLEEAEAAMSLNHNRGSGVGVDVGGYIGEDPGLDQFMEAYSEMLSKYEQELTKPFKEAMLFLTTIEAQFKALTLCSSSNSPSSGACGEIGERNGSSEEDIDVNTNFIDPSVEDRDLKGQLLRKYSGYLGGLRQEFLKKRKKGKLPKEARQHLLDWWSRHYKWPYPSESQKVALAEATGLEQKQINNWFINQRKRHWKPSEDMQFVVMDAANGHPHYNYMDTVLGNPFTLDASPTFL